MEYEEYYLEQQPNKPVFPSGDTNEDGFLGINFREALILALASNPQVIDYSCYDDKGDGVKILLGITDQIIKLLVEERKKK